MRQNTTLMKKRIILTEQDSTTGTTIFLASMSKNHITHLIKHATHDPTLLESLGWSPCFQPDETEEFIEALSNFVLPYSKKSEPVLFGVYLDLKDFPIGYIALKGINMETRTAEPGQAVFDPKYRAAGIGTLALKRMLQYAFEELQLKIVGGTIVPSNQACLNMCKKLGFVIREPLRNAWTMPDGRVTDLIWVEAHAPN